jgi:putative phosphoesterase
MRVAIVSDIHGNLTALEAVIADLQDTAPDVILHGGDLAQGGARPAEVVDRIRQLGWQGVCGNTDEMLWNPGAFREFAAKAPAMKKLFDMTEQIRLATCDCLGGERIAWLKTLPMTKRQGEIALVHASPNDVWRGPGRDASDEELRHTFGPLNARVAVYGHIHAPFVRKFRRLTVANTGSVSLSYDGDWRASYLLVDRNSAEIRRVEYDLERELQALMRSGLPHGEWVCQNLRAGRFVGVQ